MIELYDMASDPGESRNLAATETAARNELLDDLLTWFRESGALLPTQPNPAYDPDFPRQPRSRQKNRQ